MKGIAVQNHYEILEVPPSAPPEDIDRAYRLALSTWSEGSLALYSVFDDGDAGAVRSRVQEAYDVLSDRERRQAYDLEVLGVSAFGEVGAGAPSAPSEPALHAPDPEPLEDLEAAEEEKRGEFDGSLLRRARLRRGIELGQISEITKVNPDYLIAIEEENFEGMPAPVYVRGFVVAYAQVLGLDAAVVADSYMPRLDAARKSRGRGRLLGGRRSVEDRG